MVRTDLSIKLLRWSIGFTFLWFGVLKFFNASPVLEIIRQAMPLMLGESQLFMFGLSLLEIAIGFAFLANKFVKLAVLVMTAHLIVATASVLFTQGFSPRFPVLSLAGEFVVKNLVLIASGFVLFTSHETKEKSE
ncbi:MAG: DoxX family membrane protein [Candidatus Levybacteria bacterium]|nr:DoxX family membrane protein [Candidatus Levybacteria bacterium]